MLHSQFLPGKILRINYAEIESESIFDKFCVSFKSQLNLSLV